MDKSNTYYKTVDSLTEDADSIVIPNGEIWRISNWKGSANGNGNTHVCLIWDYEGSNEEIIALTYWSDSSEIGILLEGDGSKKLAIVLRNDSLNNERLGAQYSAVRIS